MKSVIKEVKYLKESESKYGTLHNFMVYYDDKKAYYSSKTKDQNKFIAGQEAEFNEEEKEGTNNNKYLVIKPIQKVWSGKSGYSKEIKKEQSKYSGFAVSYVKDLIIAGKVPLSDWQKESKSIFEFMVSIDKTIAND